MSAFVPPAVQLLSRGIFQYARHGNSSGKIKDFQLYFSLLPFKGI